MVLADGWGGRRAPQDIKREQYKMYTANKQHTLHHGVLAEDYSLLWLLCGQARVLAAERLAPWPDGTPDDPRTGA